jgi:hypothetical protein
VHILNWRRGLFRLWLVLSALWIAVSWSATEPIFKMRIATTDHRVFHFLGHDFDFPPNTKRAVIERVFTDIANGKWDGGLSPPHLKWSEVTSDKPIDQRVAEAIGDYQPYSWPALIVRLWGPIILPPFGLMLAAIIVAWIVHGFRRSAD